jgi:hypothetical protein
VLKWPELQADHFLHLVSRLRMSRGKTFTLTMYLLGVHRLLSFNKCTLKVFPHLVGIFISHSNESYMSWHGHFSTESLSSYLVLYNQQFILISVI